MTKICNFINLCGCSIETRSKISEFLVGLWAVRRKDKDTMN